MSVLPSLRRLSTELLASRDENVLSRDDLMGSLVTTIAELFLTGNLSLLVEPLPSVCLFNKELPERDFFIMGGFPALPISFLLVFVVLLVLLGGTSRLGDNLETIFRNGTLLVAFFTLTGSACSVMVLTG